MGANQFRKDFVNNYIKPSKGDVVLDVGCGPADILKHLPDVEYYGLDISSRYINSAKAKFGGSGNFYCSTLNVDILKRLPKCDIVIAIGVLHHLDDETAQNVVSLAYKALRPQGRFVTCDPCFDVGQNSCAKFLISKDRGQHVRTAEEYYSVASGSFKQVNGTLKHKTFIPYTHWFMECTK